MTERSFKGDMDALLSAVTAVSREVGGSLLGGARYLYNSTDWPGSTGKPDSEADLKWARSKMEYAQRPTQTESGGVARDDALNALRTAVSAVDEGALGLKSMYNLGPGKETVAAAENIPENVKAGIEMILAPTDFMTAGAAGTGKAIFIGWKGFKKLEKAGLDHLAVESPGPWPDGKPRWEISDAGQETNFPRMKVDQIRYGRDSVHPGLIFPQHEALNVAYGDEMEKYKVGFMKGGGGSHNPTSKTIKLGTQGDTRGVALHEINHLIDDTEGHAKGGTPQRELNELIKGADDAAASELKRIQKIGRGLLKEHGVETYTDLPDEPRAHMKALFDDLQKLDTRAQMPGLKGQAMENYVSLAGEQSSNLVELRQKMTLDEMDEFPALEQAMFEGSFPGSGITDPGSKVRHPDDWVVDMPKDELVLGEPKTFWENASEESAQATKTKYFESYAVGNSGNADVRDFGMLSGAKAGATAEANKLANKQLKAILDERFGEGAVVNMKGRYGGVDEDSFMVEDLKLEDYDDLMEIAKSFGQESVMTPRGLLYVTGVNAGKMHPLKSKVPNRIEPLYHGSPHLKDPSEIGTGQAGLTFTTKNKEYAQTYANNMAFAGKPGGVHSYTLNSKNPANLDTDPEAYDRAIEIFNENGGWTNNADVMDGRDSPDFDPEQDVMWEVMSNPDTGVAREMAERHGYDSFVFDEGEGMDMGPAITHATLDPKNLIPLDNYSSIATKNMDGTVSDTMFAYDIDFDTLIDIPTAEGVAPHLQSKRGTHFSNTEGLTEIDPAKYGTGAAGAEKQRIAEGAAPRSFAYEALDNATPITPEPGIPQKASYTTDYRDVYDMDADPANLKGYSLGETDMENLARQLGARGVSSGRLADEGSNRAGALAYFEPQNVGVVEGQQISTRNPTSPKRLVDPNVEQLSPNLASAMENPDQFAKMTRMVQENTPLLASLKNADPETAAEAYISMVQGNLNFLWNETNPAIREMSRKWYEGANLMARNLADQHGVPLEAAAGVMAALSPKKDWYQNVGLAEAIMDIMGTKGGVGWSSEMDGVVGKIFDASKPEHERLLANIAGKRLDELTDPVEKAAWARAYDTAHSKRHYNIYAPDGTNGGLFLTKAGRPGTYGWQSYKQTAQAIRALESNGQMIIVSPAMGAQHKVRSFYNNIVAPNQGLDVTMDTHAVAAGLMQPFSGASPAVLDNLGARTGSIITGNQGTYALNAEAYVRAAAEQGVLPREMQSVVWETVRGLFNNKNKATKDAAASIWLDYKNGIIGQPEAQARIMEMAGGINNPTWIK